MNHSSLPQPDTVALAHSQQLFDYIVMQMQSAGGVLPFSEFMQLALYSPELGYYSSHIRKFGSAGDFITAPEISPLFSQCLAKQCGQIITELGDENCVILEFGAGSGVMAAEILQTLARDGQLPAHYWILEVSAALQLRQQETLQAQVPELFPRVQWLTQLPNAPFKGVILANEVLDAMPVARFQMQETGIHEFYVEHTGAAFDWTLRPVQNPELVAAITALERAFPVGYCSELNLSLSPWLNAVSDCLQAGAVLLLDYGFPRHEYYHPQRDSGTLMCHYRHYSHSNPLILLGLQDITAHVDFTAVAEAASAAELTVAGFTNQANFLLGCGIGALLENVGEVGSAAYLQQAAQVKTLIMPSEMGELFKAMALTRGLAFPLLGFGRDERERL